MRTRTRPRGLAAAFTLLEIMIVLMIIGILSTYLVVNAPQWIDSANMTASHENMKRIYRNLLEYQRLHNGSFPRDTGQRFLLRPWKDGMMERTEQQAKIFFSPAYPFEDCAVDMGYAPGDIGVVEYLNDWEAIAPGYISYAGFDHGGDREVRRELTRSPGKTAIIGDATWVHRSAFLYMTADGFPHRLLKADFLDRTGYSEEELPGFRPGPGCEIEELQTISNE